MNDIRERINDIIQLNAAQFDSIETISVEPAAEMENGRPQWTMPYIRVVARQPEILRPQLPSQIDSVPIRVIAATMEEQALRFVGFRRASLVTPEMAASEWRTGFLSSETEAPKNYSRLTYRPLNPSELTEVNEPMTLTLHVSPDHGWPMLRDFLKPASSWSIAMFDFTAQHIYDRLCEAVTPDGTLSLCLGPNESGGEGSRPTGISEGQVVDGLRDLLEQRFRFAWASVGISHQFASAYHIKVAVRDTDAFWLSSGNWQSSNQPPRDFSMEAPDPTPVGARDMAKTNREWHVIVENSTLATIFRDYIEKDRETSELDGAAEAVRPISILPIPRDDEFTLEFRSPSPLMAEEEAAKLPRRVFPALIFKSGLPVKVQPILSPDNYVEHVLALINRAEHRLWFQNQSLAIATSISPAYRSLLDALRIKCWEIEDSRVIVRDLIRPQTLDVLRMLARDGFPMGKIRVMKTCHTKGILVDSRWTLVGSHNWTNEGTCYNRDASLLFDDPRTTQYFEDVLDHDWRYLAVQLNVDVEMPSGVLRLPGEIISGEKLVLDPRLDNQAD